MDTVGHAPGDPQQASPARTRANARWAAIHGNANPEPGRSAQGLMFFNRLRSTFRPAGAVWVTEGASGGSPGAFRGVTATKAGFQGGDDSCRSHQPAFPPLDALDRFLLLDAATFSLGEIVVVATQHGLDVLLEIFAELAYFLLDVLSGFGLRHSVFTCLSTRALKGRIRFFRKALICFARPGAVHSGAHRLLCSRLCVTQNLYRLA